MYFIKKFLLAFLFIGFFSSAFGYEFFGLPQGSYSMNSSAMVAGEPVVMVTVSSDVVASGPRIYGQADAGQTERKFWLQLKGATLSFSNQDLNIDVGTLFLENSTISLTGENASLTVNSEEITVKGNSFIKTIAPSGGNGRNCYKNRRNEVVSATSGENGKSAGSIELNAKVVFSENSSLEILSQGGNGGNGGKKCSCGFICFSRYLPGGSGGNAGEIFVKSVDSTALNSSLSLKSIGGTGGKGAFFGGIDGERKKVSIGKDSENNLVGSLEGFTPVLVEAGELFINSDDSAVIDSVIDLSSHDPASATFNFCKARFKHLEIGKASSFSFFIVDADYFWNLFDGKIKLDDPKNAVHLFKGATPPTEPVYNQNTTKLHPNDSGKCAAEAAAVLKPVIFSFFASVVKPDLTGASGTIESLALTEENGFGKWGLSSVFDNPSDFNGFVNLSFGAAPLQKQVPLLELWLGNLYWFDFGLKIGEESASGRLPLQTTPLQEGT